MANWKVLLKNVLLADGCVDDSEVKIIRKELLADGVVAVDELEFLADLRRRAKQVTPAFDKFFFEALKSNILADGSIDAGETRTIKKILLADGKIDPVELKFLKSLKKAAEKTCPEFDKLYATLTR